MATLPNPNPVPNSGTITYSYQVDPSLPNTSGGNNTNIVNTQINTADIVMTKSRNLAYANVGDTIVYTIAIKNSGNVTATNVVFTDTIPNGTTFINNSVSVNSVNQPGASPAPPTGVTITSIAPNSTATVVFNVLVNQIPSPNPIPNNSTTNYTYVVDPISSPAGISGGRNSNQVTTQVNNANLQSTKAVDKTNAKIGDVLKYTIVLTNSGNVTANNVVFKDTIPNGTTFVSNTFAINNVPQSGVSPAPPTGATIGTLAPGGTVTLTFNVTVATFPNPNPIPNSGTTTYTYTVDPSVPNGLSGSTNTNIVNTQLNQATIDNTNGGGMVKSVDKKFAKVGEVVTYTITLKNTGNVTATNVVLTDTIPNGTTFVSNSVFVNGTQQSGASPAPPTGVNVGSIGPGSATTLVFQVVVNTVPNPNPIPNNSTVNYSYTVDPAFTDGQSGSGNSNQVTTQVNQATIDNTNGGGLVKSVNKSYAQIGDVLTYTITLKNTGNVSANNVVFTDTIPNGTTFATNSVFVNNINQPGASPAPPTGVTVGTIGPNSVATVVFNVVVNTIPNPNPIPNNGTVNYTFTTDPSVPNGNSGSGNTNQVTTQVNQADLTIVKQGTRTNAKVGDVINYNITLKNAGNVTATNVILTDTIPNGTTFVTNSVFLNSIQQPGANPNPPTGVTVGTIAPGATTVLSFQVVVNTIPSPNPIPNNSTVKYNYTTDPSVPNGGSASNNSNQYNTLVNQATIDNSNGGGLVKAVDKAYADVGDVLNYTITLKNTGNVTANNVVFTDTIPNGTNFVTDSVFVNNVQQTGQSPAPPTGVNVGSIAPGAATTIRFQVTVATIPSPNPIPNNGTVNYTFVWDPSSGAFANGSGNTNTVNTQVNTASFSNQSGGLVKSVDKTNAKVGDVLNYTITLKNTGNVTANNIVFTDTIPNGTTFVSNSLFFNNVQQTGANPAPPTGFNVGSLAPGAVATIRFQVTVAQIPNPNPIPNTGKVAYTYTTDPSSPNGKSGQNLSNTVNTSIGQATIDYNNGGGLVKSVDKRYAQVGDILTYTIALGNTGNVTANNVIFTDTIPNGTTFVTNSVFVNGTQQTGASPAPPTGVNMGNIGPGTVSTIVFQVVVNTIPSPNPIPNNSTVNYTYTVDPNNPNGQSGSGNSNQVTTQVNQATIDNTNGGGLTKSVNKTNAQVGDVLTYTIRLKNTGNVTANNVVFTDTIPNDTTFVTNSVFVNGNQQSGASPAPPTGVTVGSIAPGATTTLVFQVIVNTIPNPNPIPNAGTVNYNFTIDPSLPNGGSASGNTNIVNTQVNQATIDNTNGGGLVKSVDKAYAKVGDVLNYTITLKNTGNVTAANVVLTDTIPNGTTFVTNSVFVNGTQQTGASPAPPIGVNAGSIGPGNTTTVIFQVVVNTVPNPNPIPNNSTVKYNFTLDPAVPNGGSGSGNSNQVTTQVNQATIDNTNGGGLVKAVDKAYADVGDVLNYTITLKNTGNVTADNVVFTDTIPNGTTFVTNSVFVNGTQQSGASPAPPTGVNVGSISPGAATTIRFQVTVATIPVPNPIPNSGTVNYNYTVDPALPDGQSGSGNSNTVNTQVNTANFSNGSGGLVKTVDKTNAKVGDVLNYTLTLKNTGNVTATNVILTDTIPSGTTFVTNSVFLNGTQQTGASPAPPTGVTVGSLAPGASATVRFQVTVATIPNPNPIPNEGKVTYNYTVDPAVPNGKSGANLSNTVNTTIGQANIDNNNGGGLIKYVNKNYAQVGDILTYTISLGNTGNVTANNVVLTDTIPNGTSFITDSVFVNGVQQTGASPAPPTGVNVGNIGPGTASTVVFQVRVTTIPSPNPIPNNSTVKYTFTIDPAFPDGQSGAGNSNTVKTQVNQGTIDNTNGGGLVKSVDKTNAKVGDVLNYTITLKNTGNVTANNVVFTDTIPNDTTFVTNSVFLNGVQQSGASPAPPTGVNVGSIGPGSVATLRFQVTVNTIPNPNPIPNNGTVNYTFTIDPSVPNGGSGSGNTNTVNTQVNQATIDNNNGGGLVKTVDKANAKVGDVLLYTITLKNTGNVTANNVVLTDTIPSGTTFVSGSLKVNTVTQPGSPAPPTGVNVGFIPPGGVTTVTFNVTVGTIPNPNPIPNNGTVNYTFTTDPSVPNGSSGSGNTNTVTTQVNQATIDNKNGGGLVKSVDKAYADVGDTLTYTVTLKNTGNVSANNVVFTDTIPNDTTFVTDSVFVNGNQQVGASPAPPTGVNVGTIGPNVVTTIIFKVVVNTIPNPNPIPNTGTVNYTYTLDPAIPDGASGAGNSNTVNTQVNTANFSNGSGGLTKTVDKAYAKVGDTLKYTVVLKNTGNVNANNVVFTDTIPNDTTFINNSVFINGTNQTGANPAPPSGITLSSIAPGGTTTIVFSVLVNTIPSPNPIPNTGKVAYTYTIDPSTPNGKSGQNLSNEVTTQINQGGFNSTNGSVVKAVDKAFAKVGDVLNYTITLINKGNVTANNIVFKDTIPNGTSFVTNSLFLNGVQQPGASPAPPTGFTVGSIAPGATSSILFQVVVNTIPSPNPIPNSGTINYTYTVDPANPDGQPGSANTNIVNTQVNQGSMDNGSGGLTKTVDKAYAKVGDTLTYTITLKNTGNVAVNNVVFTDTIPNDTTFVSNSVRLNGITQTGANPQSGINIATMAPGAVNTIVFNVTVNTIPSPNPIPNSGTVNYIYTVDPANPNGQSGSGNTNTVNTQVNQGTIDNNNGGGLVKAVDKAYAKVGDTLNYTITLKNTGNVTVNNVILTDTIPSGTTFISNSVTLDNVTQPGANPAPPTGFTIASIAPGQVRTVGFSVIVNTIPSPNPIPNNATVKFVYTLDPASPNGQSGSGNSNQVTTQVNQANIDNRNGGGLVKTVDKVFANVGDTLLYTLTLKNTGNVTANNVVLTDTIPNDTAFVNNSVVVNGINRPGESPAPPIGINVGQIGPNNSVVVRFNVTVLTTPSPNPIPNSGTVNYVYTVDPASPDGQSGSGNSNIVNTRVNAAIIDINQGFRKSVNKAFAKVGDTLIYTLALTNTGTVTATNVVLTDTIPNGTSFITNSLFVNNVQRPGASPAPPTGVNVGAIGPKATTTVTFSVLVTTIPTPNPIPNAAALKYNFTVDPSVPDGGSGTGNSNIVTTQVNQATIDEASGLVKTVDKAFASLGDTLLYTIVLNNSGNVPANNVVFKDTIPNGTTFVTDSVFINGSQLTGANPAPPTGVTVGTVSPGVPVTLTFNVLVTTIPCPNPIPNSGTVNYTFTLDPASPNGQSGSGNTNIVRTQVNSGNIDPNKGGIVKSVDKTYAQVGDTLTYTVVLKNSGTVAVNNVIFTDTIPEGTTFVSSSVTQNSVPIAGNPNPPTGINLGSIAAGATQTIRFNVVVNTIPSINPIPNNASVNYTYTEDPAIPNGKSGGASSNIVNTQVNQATIDNKNGGGLVKAVDKAYAKVGDTLNYTITLRNTGNVDATNVVFTDTIPNGTTFVANSVTLDGSTITGANPQSGVTVGTIGAGGTRTIAFQVVVNTIPNPNPIPNNGTVKYNFTIDPARPNGGSGSGNTNQVTTKINQASIDTNGGGLVKSVDKAFATVGDSLKYTITLANTGNVTANNIIFTDTIPGGTTFVVNSVTLNGTPQPGATPAPGFGVAVGSLGPNQRAVVVFNVTVVTVPTVNPIPNSSTVNYTYTIDPAVPDGQNGSGNSNTVNTQVNNANLAGSTTKAVDKQYAAVNEQITYTITVKNTGNVTALGVTIFDTIPSGTSFVANSVTVNGIPQAGGNPQTGINVGNVPVGGSVALTFKIVANTIPNPNPIVNTADAAYTYNINPNGTSQGSGRTTTNAVNTTINQATLSSSKTADRSTANIGDTITYTVNLINSGNVSANNVIFLDTIPNGTTFVPNSLTVNGSATPGNPNPPSGVNIGSIGASSTAVVQYQVQVSTIPSPNPIVNSATSTYNFTVNPNNPNSNSGSTNTNLTRTTVNNADFAISKSVSSAFAKVGDQLTYTINLSNTGNVAANNVALTDAIPAGTSYVANSLFVGGINAGAVSFPSTINVGSVSGKGSTVVTFKVVVDTIPNPNPIPNNATVNFNYTVDPNNPNGASGTRTSNTVTTQVNQGYLNMAKAVDKVNAIFGDTVNYTLTLSNPGNVPVNNIVVTDPIPNGTTFVAGSVSINGVPQPGVNPSNGITITQLAAGGTAQITFAVVIGNTFPIPNPVPNTARATYSYTLNPATPNDQNSSTTSNTVNTQVNNGGFNPANGGLSKSVDKAYAQVGETLTYTVRLRNTGNVPVNNIILTDTIPNGTSFVANTVTINGTAQPGTDPSPGTGIPLGTLNPAQSAVVTFQVIVNTIPNPNPIVNKAVLNFTYNADPNRVISDAAESNGATTQVNNANVQGFTKSVNKAFAKVGDQLTYTLSITNTGNVTAQNVTITDQIPAGTTFVANSVIVNGSSKPGVNPSSGISLGNIPPGGSGQIIFNVTVVTVPTVNPIPNAGVVNYTFIKDPTQPPVSATGNTNTVFTQVNNGNLSGRGFTKAVDKAYAQVGDTLTYTITAANTGNVAVNNVIITDTIPNGTSFIPDSITVNGLPTGGDPASGIPLGTVNPGQSDVIVFKVRITQTPVPNPIPNTALANYNFLVDPNGTPTPGTASTNTVTTKVNNPDFSGNNFVKAVDKDFAGIGETVTYTISLNNKGTVAANNVKVTDVIPNGTTFVSGSVTVNGVAQAGANPQNGITLGSIAANGSAVITFKVVINTLPNPNPIPNTATLNYTYTIDPAVPNGATGTGTTNTVTTQVSDADVAITKAVDKAIANVGDKLQYTFTIRNTGNVPATNVILTDPIPSNSTFVADSVTVDGSSLPGTNPLSGLNLGTLAPGATTVVRFNATVDFIPTPNPMQNKGTIAFNYVINPNNPVTQSRTRTSNIASTIVNSAAIDGNNFTKSVNTANAKVGDILVYTINLTNSGNIEANNLVLTDAAPEGTAYVPGSVIVNGVPQPSGDITTGLALGTLASGATDVVTFRVKVTSVPKTNPIVNTAALKYTYTPDPALPPVDGSSTSNPAKTTISNANLGDALVKTVDKAIAKINDVVTYTTSVTNTGNVAANNVVFTDPIPVGTTLVPGSVTVNGSGVGQSPATGINLGTLNPGDQRTIVFKVTVNQIPVVNPIPNKSQVDYQFTVTPGQPPATGTVFSNQVTTLVSDGSLNDFRKAVDKATANVGDLLTYTVTAKNTGNIVATNVLVTDLVPAGTTFVDGSVTINGVADSTQNPNNGINTPDLLPGETVAVTFRVKVNTIPAINPIPNFATVNYSYRPDPNGAIVNGAGQTNTVTTQINSANISGTTKAVDLAYADVGDIVTYTITLKNGGNINATNVVVTDPIPVGTSFVAGSVVVNGVPQASANPGAGINVGTVAANTTVTVIFKVKVTSIPTTNPIPNAASISYNYTVTPGEPAQSGSTTTNTVTTQINSANVSGNGLTKVVDLTEANTGSVLGYTITLQNTGNVVANNVVLTDPIPNGTTFVPNSVTINGVSIPGANPASGLPVGNIAPGGTATVFFQVKVTAIPSPNPIPNRASITYNYNVNPSGPAKNATANSNTVYTTVTTAQLKNPFKNVDKTNASIGDLLTYTINFRNTGNTTATNITLIDPIPDGTEFVAGSVLINGIANSGNPSAGLSVPDLPAGGATSVSFKVKVTRKPNPNPIPNTATAKYTFIVGGVPVTATDDSNTVYTSINYTDFTDAVTKSVNKNYADFNEVLTYTISLRNSGNVTANSVVIFDPIPKGTTFVPGSVIINGTPNATANPGAGVPVPDIPANGQSSIQFNVTVNNGIPSPNPIPDTANVNYAFTVDPNNPPVTGNVSSNTVFTQVNSGKLQFNKSVDRNIADIGDELVYTISATNIGTVNAQGVVILDTIPNGTIFKDDSVSINGVPAPNENPELGINVGIIPVGGLTVITYRVIVTSIPNPNPIPNKANGSYSYSVDPQSPNKNASGTTNTVLTDVKNGNISPSDGGFVKSVDKAYAKVGDVINYTITLKNTGNVTVNNVLFTDTIPIGTTFVPNSLTVNSSPQPGVNPQGGVSLGSLGPAVSNVITFKVVVKELPVTNPIPNTGAVTYRYVVDPAAGPKNKSSLSNTVYTQVNSPNIDPNNGGLSKAVDKEFADVGDTLTYSILVSNSGNVAANNVVFTDTIPQGTTLVPNSTTINGSPTTGNVGSGLNIPSIPAGGNTTIIFKVIVNTIPQVNPIPNSGTLRYSFNYDPSLPAANGSGNTNIVKTQINSANFDTNNGSFVKIVDKTATNVNGIITYTLNVKNSGNVAATNVIVTDPIPVGTAYVANSLTVDGSPSTDNPGSGINLGTIAPGVTKVVVFKVKVTQIPPDNVVPNFANIRYSYLVNPNHPPKTVVNSSNTVRTNIFYGDLIIGKSVDKAYADQKDTLNYTISLNNVGNTTINNVVVFDTIPNGTTFTANSVSVNGSVKNGVNPQTGIQVGAVGPGQSSVVTFRVTINPAVAPNIITPIINRAVSTYNYSVDNQLVTDGRSSNDAITNVSFANFNPADGSLVKTVDKAVGTLGDVLTYTVSIKNSGNATAQNVLFTDPVPVGTTLVPGSFTVNGVSQTTNPGAGVALGNIGPSASAQVVFKVTVTTLPSPNPIPNTANLLYTYLVNPNLTPVNGNSNSNTVKTQINWGNISGDGLVKSVNTTVAAAGDVLTYVITLRNTGNVTVNNVNFTDTVPAGTTLVPNSVSVNGALTSGNPTTGIPLGSIAPGGTSTVIFNVNIVSIPNPNPIPNSATIGYSYNVDADRVVNGSGNTNIVYTNVSSPYIDPNNGDFVKSADRGTAQIGDTITYTIFVRNSGNLAATNLIVSDSIPLGTNFVPNSVTVAGNPVPGGSIANGVTIPSLVPNATVTVTFKATVVSIPPTSIVENVANLTYSFTQVPGGPSRSKSIVSNKVDVIISSADFTGDGFVKSVDKPIASVGDTITYSFFIKNKGNIPANNVVFVDTTPNGATFIPGSVILNGVSTTIANPEKGIFLGTIIQGSSQTLSYKVEISTLPSPNPMPNNAILNFTTNSGDFTTTSNSAVSNTVFVTVSSPNVIISKSVNPEVVKKGDLATYTVKVVNAGNISADNLILRDILPSELEFINGSLTIDGRLTTESIINGVNLGTLDVGEERTITFKARAVDLPVSGIIENAVTGTFEFIQVPGEAPISKTVRSNIARFKVVELNVVLTKSADRTKVNIGDTIKFTVTIANDGNVDVTNFIFKDELPPELELLPSTFLYNGKPINVLSLTRGVNIGTIKAGTTVTITYEVKVLSSACSCGIENKAYGEYNYKLSPVTPIESGKTDTSSVTISVSCPNFKQISLDNFVEIPVCKPAIEEVNDVSVAVNIIGYHVIKTIAGTSDANQTLTGYKAIITGELIGNLEYTALTAVQSVHSYTFRESFSTFIILPPSYQPGRSLDISAHVEDVEFSSSGPRTVYTSITFMLNAPIA